MAPHSSTLAWKIPWTEEPGRLQSMGSLRVGHVQQFEAMILVAFCLVFVWPRSFFWRCAHYLFLIPAIILANAIRIDTTILLYKTIGETALNNAWHIGLGYAQVAVAVALFFLVGCLLPEKGAAGSGSASKSPAPAAKKKSAKGAKS